MAEGRRSLCTFAARFCNELDKDKTTICSPFSAEVLLAMTALGCRGQTREELMQALQFSDDKTLRSTFANLTSTLQSVRGVTLNMATKIFLTNDGNLRPNLKKDSKKVFKCGLKQIDFTRNGGEEAARIMNTWVAKKTSGLIKEIISSEQLDRTTRLVLVNAIYFKGDWKVKFSANKTKKRTFHVNKSTNILVRTMFKEDVKLKFGIVPRLNAKLLEMEYKGNGASMVIVLPDEIEGLSGVMQQLAEGYDLLADVGALINTKIDVMIPKFKVEMTIDLKELLPKLGINSIFDTDSSEIDMLMSGERLVVAEAIQKAFIDVDETGTEAAAVTSMRMVQCCAYIKPPIPCFIADRPFLYLLMVRGIPLFVGVYEGSQFSEPPDEPDREMEALLQSLRSSMDARKINSNLINENREASDNEE